MAAGYLAIELERNGTYVESWQITDDEGVAIDVTGWTFAMDVKYAAGESDPPLASATVTVDNAATGELTVQIEGADFAAVDGEKEKVILAYDFVAVESGVPQVYVGGPLILVPGVTYP